MMALSNFTEAVYNMLCQEKCIGPLPKIEELLDAELLSLSCLNNQRRLVNAPSITLQSIPAIAKHRNCTSQQDC